MAEGERGAKRAKQEQWYETEECRLLLADLIAFRPCSSSVLRLLQRTDAAFNDNNAAWRDLLVMTMTPILVLGTVDPGIAMMWQWMRFRFGTTLLHHWLLCAPPPLRSFDPPLVPTVHRPLLLELLLFHHNLPRLGDHLVVLLLHWVQLGVELDKPVYQYPSNNYYESGVQMTFASVVLQFFDTTYLSSPVLALQFKTTVWRALVRVHEQTTFNVFAQSPLHQLLGIDIHYRFPSVHVYTCLRAIVTLLLDEFPESAATWLRPFECIHSNKRATVTIGSYSLLSMLLLFPGRQSEHTQAVAVADSLFTHWRQQGNQRTSAMLFGKPVDCRGRSLFELWMDKSASARCKHAWLDLFLQHGLADKLGAQLPMYYAFLEGRSMHFRRPLSSTYQTTLRRLLPFAAKMALAMWQQCGTPVSALFATLFDESDLVLPKKRVYERPMFPPVMRDPKDIGNGIYDVDEVLTLFFPLLAKEVRWSERQASIAFVSGCSDDDGRGGVLNYLARDGMLQEICTFL